jgi:peptidoglycan/LPS O-acetylase OafA/YrhL
LSFFKYPLLFVLYLDDSYKTAFLYQGGLTVFAFAVGVLIVWIVTHKTSQLNHLLQFSPLVWIGKTSYGIYLWHSAALAFAERFQISPSAKLLLALTLTLAITTFSYYLIELPFLRRKEFFKAT